jgi:hypothetical protein
MSENIITENKSFFSERTGKILALIGLVSILLAAIIFLILGSWSFTSVLDEAKIGMFGDFIGGVVGSILALAGVVLYYVALKEQRREIGISQEAVKLQVEALNQQIVEFRDQKVEMQETRKVYDEQTKEFKRQTEIAKLHQFDSSFYALLTVFIELRKVLNAKDNNNKNYFYSIYLVLKSVDIKDKPIQEVFKIIESKYTELFYGNYSELTHYYKTVYRLLLKIESSNIDNSEKITYSKILRSQLTSYELLILHYNYHSSLGENVRPLAIKYKLFKHLPILDRVEFNYDGNYQYKSPLSSYLGLLSGLIVTNLTKYNDIDEITDINISETRNFIGLESNVSLRIDDFFELSVSFDKDSFNNQTIINREFVKKYISMCIFDALFLSKYKIPDSNILEIEDDQGEQSNSLKVKFIIRNIKDI